MQKLYFVTTPSGAAELVSNFAFDANNIKPFLRANNLDAGASVREATAGEIAGYKARSAARLAEIAPVLRIVKPAAASSAARTSLRVTPGELRLLKKRTEAPK